MRARDEAAKALHEIHDKEPWSDRLEHLVQSALEDYVRDYVKFEVESRIEERGFEELINNFLDERLPPEEEAEDDE